MKKLFACCVISLFFLAAFTPRKKNKPRLPDEFVIIPASTYYSAVSEEDPYFHGLSKNRQKKDSSKIIAINSFYISKYEVTNQQYKQFYNETVSSLTEEERKIIACDTMGWRQELTYCEPLVQYYYQHPAYKDYPVVNVSYEGAVQYCKWLKEKIQSENPGYLIEVSLPSKQQWVFAAQGGRSNAMYPWGNYYLRDKKGMFLCNFKKLGDISIVRNRQTGKPEIKEEIVQAAAGGLKEQAFYTAEVKSYHPNDYGLYNVCGNVAEMVNEKSIAMGGSWNDYGGDVHIKSEASYDKPTPTIGFRPVITIKEKTR
jgi:formylglycine-generating enzyme required for sulfatase activity